MHKLTQIPSRNGIFNNCSFTTVSLTDKNITAWRIFLSWTLDNHPATSTHVDQLCREQLSCNAAVLGEGASGQGHWHAGPSPPRGHLCPLIRAGSYRAGAFIHREWRQRNTPRVRGRFCPGVEARELRDTGTSTHGRPPVHSLHQPPLRYNTAASKQTPRKEWTPFSH